MRILLLLSLTGCMASFHPRDGLTDADMQKDVDDCEAKTNQVDSGLFTHAQYMNRCMSNKGWDAK